MATLKPLLQIRFGGAKSAPPPWFKTLYNSFGIAETFANGRLAFYEGCYGYGKFMRRVLLRVKFPAQRAGLFKTLQLTSSDETPCPSSDIFSHASDARSSLRLYGWFVYPRCASHITIWIGFQPTECFLPAQRAGLPHSL